MRKGRFGGCRLFEVLEIVGDVFVVLFFISFGFGFKVSL